MVEELLIHKRLKILYYTFPFKKNFHFSEYINAIEESLNWINNDNNYLSVVDTTNLQYILNGGIQIVYEFLKIEHPKNQNWLGYYVVSSQKVRLAKTVRNFIELYNRLIQLSKINNNKKVIIVNSLEEILRFVEIKV